jgi:Domain of unknown function (DUF5060)
MTALSFALLIVLAPGAEIASTDVPRWGRFETAVRNERSYGNPFADVVLNATFTSPSGRRVAFFGFHDGDGQGGQTGNVWKLRFMPDEIGVWSFHCSFMSSIGRPEGP